VAPDLTPSVSDLLVHAGLVRGVARAVLHGDDRVEDVVQDTWVATIEKGPAAPGPGWLVRVARRFALTVRRRDAGRRRREGAVARIDAIPSTAEIAAREETRRHVVDALLRVDEPFRSALLLRYYEGLPPREIAARLGVPTETARSRVRRGLEQLRARLLEGEDPHRERRRLAVLARLPVSASAAFVVGGLLMSKPVTTAVAAMALLLLAGGAYRVLVRPEASSREPRAGSPTSEATAAERAALAGRPSAVRTGPPVPASGPVVPPPVTPAPAGVLRGGLLSFDPSLPGRASLTVGALHDWRDAARDPIRAEAQKDGTFEVDVSRLLVDPAPGELAVLVDHPSYLRTVSRVRLAEPDPLRILVVMTRAGSLVGQVVTRSGTPIGDAVVGLLPSTEGGPSGRTFDAVRTDATGSFRLRTAAEGTYQVVVDAQGFRPAGRAEVVSGATERVVDPIVLSPGEEISGTVSAPLLPDVPLEVEVWSRWLGASIDVSGLDGVAQVTFASLTTDGTRLEKWGARVPVTARGEFRIPGIAAGPYRLRVAVAAGPGAPAANVHQDLREAQEVTVEAPARGVRLVLDGAFLALRLTSSEGAVVKGHVDVTSIRESDEERSGTYGLSTTDDGSARLLVRSGRRYVLDVAAPGFEPQRRTVRAPVAGSEQVESFALVPRGRSRRTLVLHLTHAGEESAVAKVDVAMLATRDQGEDRHWIAVADHHQAFRLSDVPAGDLRLRIRSAGLVLGGEVPYLDVEQVLHVAEEGESEARIPLVLGGWLVVAAKSPDGRYVPARCRVLDATGRSLAAWFMVRDAGGAHGSSGSLDDSAPAQVEPALQAGKYVVEVEADGFVSKRTEVTIRSGQTTTAEFALQPL
jgi:RNA polymerase sigma-70 factor (ECF subfamily)